MWDARTGKNAVSCSESNKDASIPKGNYTCACETGFNGPNCKDLAPCTEKPCGEYGTCTDATTDKTKQGYEFTCKCDANYDGITCAVSECVQQPCKNGGICSVPTGSVKHGDVCADGSDCRALTEYLHKAGVDCQHILSTQTFGPKGGKLLDYCPRACAGQPCSRGALIDTARVVHVCTCKQGYQGKSCEERACQDDIKWRDSTGTPCGSYKKVRNRPYCKDDTGTNAAGVVTTAAESCRKSCGICKGTATSNPCFPNPCVHGTCSQTTSTKHKCTCYGAWGGMNCTLQEGIVQKHTFSQCKKRKLDKTAKIPVDTSLSNVTIATLSDESLTGCHQRCCEHPLCRAFTLMAGECSLKNSPGGGECKCMCDGFGYPSCKHAKLIPNCTALCTTKHARRGYNRLTFYTIDKNKDFTYCAVQSGIQNIASVLARESGREALGNMLNYMFPVVDSFNFDTICEQIYRLLETLLGICGQMFNTGVTAVPTTKI